MKVIRRDPFARADLLRLVSPGGTCVWCGGDARYAYVLEDDYRRRGDYVKACSVGCYDTYVRSIFGTSPWRKLIY